MITIENRKEEMCGVTMSSEGSRNRATEIVELIKARQFSGKIITGQNEIYAVLFLRRRKKWKKRW